MLLDEMAAGVDQYLQHRSRRPGAGVSWHTQGMSPVKHVAGAIAESMTPDATLLRVRFRISLDMLLTLALTIIAIGLAIGYQVMGRWGARILDSR